MVLSTNITKILEGLAEVPLLKGYLKVSGRICKTFAEEDEVTNNVTVFMRKMQAYGPC